MEHTSRNCYPVYFIIIFIFTGTVSESYTGIIEVPPSDVQSRYNLDVKQETQDLTGMQDPQKASPISSINTSLEPESELSYEENIYKSDCEDNFQQLPPVSMGNDDFYNLEHFNEKSYVESPNILFVYPELNIPRPLRDIASDNMMDTSNIYGFDNNDLSKIYLRRQRSEEDILEQLEHDAIISNMLPTMDEPFYRDAKFYPTKQEVPSIPTPKFVAYFPKARDSPLLVQLGCTPQIHGIYEQSLQVPLPYYYNYREKYPMGMGQE